MSIGGGTAKHTLTASKGTGNARGTAITGAQSDRVRLLSLRVSILIRSGVFSICPEYCNRLRNKEPLWYLVKS